DSLGHNQVWKSQVDSFQSPYTQLGDLPVFLGQPSVVFGIKTIGMILLVTSRVDPLVAHQFTTQVVEQEMGNIVVQVQHDTRRIGVNPSGSKIFNDVHRDLPVSK